MPTITKRLFVAVIAALAAALLAATGPTTATATTVNSITTIVNRANPQMCMDAPGGSTDNQLKIQQYYCNGGTNQQWEFIPSADPRWGSLRNVASQKCLDVRGASTAVDATVQQYTCAGAPNQLWSYEPVTGFLIAMHSNSCIGVYSLVYKEKVLQTGCSSQTTIFFSHWSAAIP